MKIYELMQQAKITKVMPNQSAEIDHGDGTKTVVDLKKNPQALAKDPATGKVKLNKQPKGMLDKPDIRAGDEVDIEKESAPTQELFKGLHIEVRKNPRGGFDVVDTGVNGLAPAKVVKSYNNVEDATAAAKMLDAEDMKVAKTMPSSIKVYDDMELQRLRRTSGLE